MTLWTTYVIFLHSAHIWLSSQCKLKWRILSRDINKSRAWHLTLLKRLFAGKQWMIFVCLSHNFCDSICFVLTLKYCLCLDTHLQQIIQPHCFDCFLILILHSIPFTIPNTGWSEVIAGPNTNPKANVTCRKSPARKWRAIEIAWCEHWFGSSNTFESTKRRTCWITKTRATANTQTKSSNSRHTWSSW